MGKRAKWQNRETRNPKKNTKNEAFTEEDMDDEIDAFHKQRDVIPLDVDDDAGGASDEDIEQSVFDIEDDDDDDNDSDSDEAQLTGLAAKISRQQKFLRQKLGGVEDEMQDDDEEEEQRMAAWGRRKNSYYSADNIDFELQSSDEELPAEEEAEVLKLQMERAKMFSMEDFGLEEVDQDDSKSDDRAKSLEDFMVEERDLAKLLAGEVAEGAMGTTYEVKKDLNSLSKEEQMDVVLSSAPELIGLLSELKDALDQLESKVKPLLCKAKETRNPNKDGIRYLEVKQLLLLAYCQAITFYLLLKSEGHPVRDHPVIARLVEIKNLLDKVKHIDGRLPSQIEEILNQDHVVKRNSGDEFEPCTKNHELSPDLAKKREVAPVCQINELVKVSSSKGRDSKHEKSIYQNNKTGLQSMEMLKIRASLEEKLKHKGIYSSENPKTDGSQKHLLKPLNGRLETLNDFDDEVIDKDAVRHGGRNGQTNSLHLGKLSQLVAAKVNKPKVISGDDDLPKRDDIGERRRKHELRVLAKAGVKSMDDSGDKVRVTENGAESMDFDLHNDDEESHESEDEFYKEVKQQRAAKLSAKEELYSRTPTVPSLMESTIDGKRQISYQMEKNRGLTRARKKLTKIPRKKYKLKHQKAVVRRKGQVRDIKRPSGPYGGEASGINAGISRSVRFKS